MRALALISGGLDSTLAAMVIREQGIEVLGIKYSIPFYLRKKKPLPDIGIAMREIDISRDFLSMFKDPRYGFGSQMNPCIDCKILMCTKAKELMPELGASFIVTGEVLGQRPMSQHRQALELIARRSGLERLVVRPLSARLLAETIPEKEGWIDRSKLLNFGGRGRKGQLALAHRFGIKGYAQPAGGCLLTEPEFVKRLKELSAHQELNVEDVELLKIGRHFRLSEDAKLIVGRDEQENAALVSLAKADDYLLYPGDDLAGPTSLARGTMDEGLITLSARITRRYCDLRDESQARIWYKKIPDTTAQAISVSPVEETIMRDLRIS